MSTALLGRIFLDIISMGQSLAIFFYYITGGLKGECCPEGYLGITVLQAHPVGVTRVGYM